MTGTSDADRKQAQQSEPVPDRLPTRLSFLTPVRQGVAWLLAVIVTIGLIGFGLRSGQVDDSWWLLVAGMGIAIGSRRAFVALRGTRAFGRQTLALLADVVGIVSFLLTVIGFGVAVDDDDTSDEDAEAKAQEQPLDCGDTGRPAAEESEAAVSAVVDRGLAFSEVTYALRPLDDGRPGLTIAGRQTGDAPPGKTMFAIAHAASNTTDELGNSGTKRYLPALEIIAGPDSCWKMAERAIGYPRIWGVTYQYQIHLVDRDTAETFRRYKRFYEANRECISHGYTEDQLQAFQPELIAEFPVITAGVEHPAAENELQQIECPMPEDLLPR